MSLLSWILVALLLMIAGLLAYAATRPDRFRVQRTAVIKAPAETLFALIDDLKLFNNWNPYERKDPTVRGEYSGSARGVGAAYAWRGKKVGQGRMEITDSQTPSKVTMQLDFVKPFKARNTAEFTLWPQGERLTAVTWAMHGPAPYINKLMGVILDMDRLIGKDFEAGLENLKQLTERRAGGAPHA